MIIVFFIISLASYAALASYAKVALWKCLIWYFFFACFEVAIRYVPIPLALPVGIFVLIEEIIKAGTALILLNRKDCLPFLAIAAFGFAEMGIIKPLMILESGEGYQAIVQNNMIFASLLYLNVALMHTISAIVLTISRKPILIMIAIIPNMLFHLIFNMTRNLYALIPELHYLNIFALALETLAFVLIIFFGLRRYRMRAQPTDATIPGTL